MENERVRKEIKLKSLESRPGLSQRKKNLYKKKSFNIHLLRFAIIAHFFHLIISFFETILLCSDWFWYDNVGEDDCDYHRMEDGNGFFQLAYSIIIIIIIIVNIIILFACVFFLNKFDYHLLNGSSFTYETIIFPPQWFLFVIIISA